MACQSWLFNEIGFSRWQTNAYSVHRGGEDQNLLDRGALGKAVDGGEFLIMN